MKKTSFISSKILIATTLSLSLLLGGCSSPSDGVDPTQTKTEITSANKQTVEVMRGSINSGYAESLTVSGEANEMKFRKQGYLNKIHCSIGDAVKKGDLLVELDTNEIQAQIKISELELEKAKTKLANFQTAQTDIKDIDLEIALKRMQQLGEQYEQTIGRYGIFPTEEEQRKIDLILLQLEKAKIEYNGMLEKKSGQTPDIELAKATITKLESQIAQQKESLKDFQLIAPCNGVVVNINLEKLIPGRIVPPNETVIIVENADKLKLLIDFRQSTEITSTIKKDSFKESVVFFEGTWDKPYPAQIIPYIDSVTKEVNPEFPYQVKLMKLPLGVKEHDGYYYVDEAIKNDLGEIAAENFTINTGTLLLQVIVSSMPDTLYIPKKAARMIGDGTGKTAMVTVLEDGKEIEKMIVIEGAYDMNYSVEDGLKEGDIIVY